MNAFVYFWDGHHFGARILTVARKDLEQRIRKILKSSTHVGRATALFVAYDMADGIQCEVWPAPPARTISQYVQASESEGEWPDNHSGKSWPAGVFIVNVVTGNCRITGGLGFGGTIDTCNPRALRELDLSDKEEDDED